MLLEIRPMGGATGGVSYTSRFGKDRGKLSSGLIRHSEPSSKLAE